MTPKTLTEMLDEIEKLGAFGIAFEARKLLAALRHAVEQRNGWATPDCWGENSEVLAGEDAELVAILRGDDE